MNDRRLMNLPRILSSIFILATLSAMSQNVLDFSVRAGLNIGATAPVSFPVEVREVRSFNPNLNGTVEFYVSRTLADSCRWAVASGLRLERQSMSIHARVKSYRTEITSDEGASVGGVWTGDVRTNYDALQLTVPVAMVYRVNNRLHLEVGAYGSLLLNSDFSGSVFDGYLREGDPTGEKIVYEGDNVSHYDFKNHLRNLHVGLTFGAEYHLTDHLLLAAHFNYGLLNIFDSNFTTVSFAMHPMFANLSVGYRF